MNYSDNPEWIRFRNWKKKKDLLHFMMKFRGRLADAAWYGMRLTNRNNPDLRQLQKY